MRKVCIHNNIIVGSDTERLVMIMVNIIIVIIIILL